MKRSYVYLGMVLVGFIVNLLFIHSAWASWPLNTPDIQSNPMWVGENLVWNDDRLGSLDIFIEHSDQSIEPLVALYGDQKLVATAGNQVIFEQIVGASAHLFSIDIEARIMRDITGSAITNTSPEFNARQDGSCEYASEANGDLKLLAIEAPWVTLATPLNGYNISTITGTGSGKSVHLKAALGNTSFEQDTPIINGEWSFSNLIPSDTSDGIYHISAYAVSVCNKSPVVDFGDVIIDHSPPVLDSAVETTPDLDSVKIHWRTDEKTTTQITITDQTTGEIQEHNYKTSSYSHTNTISSLAPGTTYVLTICAIDKAGNKSIFSKTFTTLSLLSQLIILSNSSDLISGKSGIWEGVVLAEPGIIADDQVVVMLDRPWILHWTLGHAPPMIRGSTVRFMGSVNHGGTYILMHSDRSILMIDAGQTPEIFQVNSGDNLESMVSKWIKVSGILTHVTKMGWEIQQDSRVLKIHWNSNPAGEWKKGQEVTVSGFLYFNASGDVQLFAQNIELINDVISKATKPKIILTKTESKEIILSSNENGSNIIEAKNTENSKVLKNNYAEVRDKGDYLWYAVVLIGLSFATAIIFFLHHG